jgi:hypothetical protein
VVGGVVVVVGGVVVAARGRVVADFAVFEQPMSVVVASAITTSGRMTRVVARRGRGRTGCATRPLFRASATARRRVMDRDARLSVKGKGVYEVRGWSGFRVRFCLPRFLGFLLGNYGNSGPRNILL